MSLLYADTSALVGAYLADEPDHLKLQELLLRGNPVVTSEIARVEFGSAVMAAARDRRIRKPDVILARFDADCGADGMLTLLRLDSGPILELAYRLVRNHVLGSLDAIHLAVAASEAKSLAGDEDVVLVTRDSRQIEAARKMGIVTA